jgi:endonuclease G
MPTFAVEVTGRTLEQLKALDVYKHRSEFPPPGPEVRVPRASEVRREAGTLQERVIQDPNLLPVAFLEEGALRQRAVARLAKKSTSNPLGSPWGTGFLVSNSLIMTNNHVISSPSEANQILVQFNYQEDYNGIPQNLDTWLLDPASFFYTSVALDFTLVRVKAKLMWPLVLPSAVPAAETVHAFGRGEAPIVPAAVGPIQLLKRYPGSQWGFVPLVREIEYLSGALLNCIQHPAGRMKEVAVQKNELTHVYTDRVHYTTDTEPGSSGSPVFNNAWDLVALHHAAGDPSATGGWADNEGMRIDSIVTHLRAQFAASNPALLAELGIQ